MKSAVDANQLRVEQLESRRMLSGDLVCDISPDHGWHELVPAGPLEEVTAADVLGDLYRTPEDDAHSASLKARNFTADFGLPRSPGDVLANTPLADTFRLNSHPNANLTLYLDWVESHDPADWSTSELNFIRTVWAQAAEDFMPFGVNVTTEQPDPGDMGYGVGDPDRFGHTVAIERGSNRGVNYSGFRRPTGATSYVWTAFNNVNFTSLAVSHETGHALGLRHDGSTAHGEYYHGHGSGSLKWAAIMGNGSGIVSQWSHGEYYQATNPGEDDLAEISAIVGYRPDLAGDTLAEAAVLNVDQGTNVNQLGIIEQNTDVDRFRFLHGGGPLTLNIDPAAVAANLDVLAELHADDGSLVATSNPTNRLDADFSLDLPAGEYVLAVDGTGWGSPLTSGPSGWTDYGSIGLFRVTGTIAAPTAADTASPLAAVDVDDITAPSTDSHQLLVTYTDLHGVDTSTIGFGDIRVTGPNGYDQPASLVAVNEPTPGTVRAAVYQMQGPGGGDWTDTDNGTYTIHLVEGELTDVNGNPAKTATLGTFQVDVPAPGATLPVFDDFESGRLGDGWQTDGDPGDVSVTTHPQPRSGQHQLLLHHPGDIGLGSYTQSATLTVDLEGHTGVNLWFDFYIINSSSTGSAVSVSTDGGTSWYDVHPLAQSSDPPLMKEQWYSRSVDVDQSLADLGLTATSATQFRFQQYGFYGIDSSTPWGVLIDNVAITSAQTGNDSPAIGNETYGIDEDQQLQVPSAGGILDNDSDPNGDPIAALAERQPEHGTLVLLTDGTLTYTPDPDCNGTDSFSYRAFDGRTGSMPVADVTIHIAALPDAATDILLDAATVLEFALNGTVVGNLTAVDPDVGDTNIFTLIDDAGGRFRLNGEVIEVADGSLLDAGQQNSHTIRVRATGLDGLGFEKDLHVGVIDVATLPAFQALSPAGPRGLVSSTTYALDEGTGVRFEFDVNAGRTIAAVAAADRPGLDLYLTLYDPTGNLVASSDDAATGGDGQNPAGQSVYAAELLPQTRAIQANGPTTAGTYQLELISRSGRGNVDLRVLLDTLLEQELVDGGGSERGGTGGGIGNTWPWMAEDLDPHFATIDGVDWVMLAGRSDTTRLRMTLSQTDTLFSPNLLPFRFELPDDVWVQGPGTLTITARGDLAGPTQTLAFDAEGQLPHTLFVTGGATGVDVTAEMDLPAQVLQDIASDRTMEFSIAPSEDVADLGESEIRLDFEFQAADDFNKRDYFKFTLDAGESVSAALHADSEEVRFQLMRESQQDAELLAKAVPSADGQVTWRLDDYVAGAAGTYLILVEPTDQPIDYTIALSVADAAGTVPPLQVVGSEPADGGTIFSPSPVLLHFSHAIDALSVDGADLTIGGVAAGGVTIVDGDTLAFGLPPDLPVGSHTLSLGTATVRSVSGADNEPYVATFEHAGPTLSVTELVGTASGFVAHFNQPIDATHLNIYDVEAAIHGAADVTLVGNVAGPVPGSLIVRSDSVTFVATGGVLPADAYNVTLRSAADSFITDSGLLLDGNGDGTTGDDFVGTFTSVSAGVSVGLPDFARGPGQAVDVPATTTGLPLTFTDDRMGGEDVSSIDLTISYDPVALTITAVGAGPDAPADVSISTDMTMPGLITLSLRTTATPLARGALHLITLTADVPAAASYGNTHVITFSNLTVEDAEDQPVAAAADDAVHVVALLGDTTGSGDYSGLDAQRVARMVVGLDRGLEAFPRIDPFVVGDVTGNGLLSGLDAQRIAQMAVGLSPDEIPPLPVQKSQSLRGLPVGQTSSFVQQPGYVLSETSRALRSGQQYSAVKLNANVGESSASYRRQAESLTHVVYTSRLWDGFDVTWCDEPEVDDLNPVSIPGYLSPLAIDAAFSSVNRPYF